MLIVTCDSNVATLTYDNVVENKAVPITVDSLSNDTYSALNLNH